MGLAFGRPGNPFGSGLESDNWNKKNLEFGAYLGPGAASRVLSRIQSELGVLEGPRKSGRLLASWQIAAFFPLFCSGPLNAEMWMHTEIKAIHCVLKVFFFFLFRVDVKKKKTPFEAATIKYERRLMLPFILFFFLVGTP